MEYAISSNMSLDEAAFNVKRVKIEGCAKENAQFAP